MAKSVKSILTGMLKESIEIAFPIKYKKPKDIPKMLHLEQALKVPQKKGDYFSISGERIFRKNVKQGSDKGYFGLPTPLEVSQDIMVQIPSNDMIQAMEAEQYFFEDEAPIDSQASNGYHINFYLRNSYVQGQIEFIVVQDHQGKLFNEEKGKKNIEVKFEISETMEQIEDQRAQLLKRFLNSYCKIRGFTFITEISKNLSLKQFNFYLIPFLSYINISVVKDQETIQNQKQRINNYLDSDGKFTVSQIFETSKYAKLRDLAFKPQQNYKLFKQSEYDKYDKIIDQIFEGQKRIKEYGDEFQFIIEDKNYDRQIAMLLIYLIDDIYDFQKTYDINLISKISQKVLLLLDLYANEKGSDRSKITIIKNLYPLIYKMCVDDKQLKNYTLL